MDELTMTEKANIIIEALPYIQKYHNKIVVIKYGGNAMTSPDLKKLVMKDLALLNEVGIKVVLVHGGGPEINKMLDALNLESHFVNGLRYTDEQTMQVVQMVLCGKINKDLVSMLESYNARAIGISGVDGNLITAEKMSGDVDYGFVGEIKSVDSRVIIDILNNGYIPIISSLGKNEKGEVFNLNADTTAAAIAGALKAENLILMTDIKGIFKDIKDENSFVPVIKINEVDNLINEGIIKGGMIPKISCVVDAVKEGVKKAIILDGREPHSILVELLSDKGVGTMFDLEK
jgi:acetylglutamate kinase